MNHILVVDDETEIRSSLEDILREEGYGVATAATAAEALVLVQDAPYDVVLLDIWLPDRDGLDVLKEVHAMGPEVRPEVVIISGPRHYRNRSEGDKDRRIRFPGEAAFS